MSLENIIGSNVPQDNPGESSVLVGSENGGERASEQQEMKISQRNLIRQAMAGIDVYGFYDDKGQPYAKDDRFVLSGITESNRKTAQIVASAFNDGSGKLRKIAGSHSTSPFKQTNDPLQQAEQQSQIKKFLQRLVGEAKNKQVIHGNLKGYITNKPGQISLSEIVQHTLKCKEDKIFREYPYLVHVFADFYPDVFTRGRGCVDVLSAGDVISDKDEGIYLVVAVDMDTGKVVLETPENGTKYFPINESAQVRKVTGPAKRKIRAISLPDSCNDSGRCTGQMEIVSPTKRTLYSASPQNLRQSLITSFCSPRPVLVNNAQLSLTLPQEDGTGGSTAMPPGSSGGAVLNANELASGGPPGDPPRGFEAAQPCAALGEESAGSRSAGP